MKKFSSVSMTFFLIFFIFFNLSTPLYAQKSQGGNNFFDNYVYQFWTSFGGLTGTTANDIYQTKDGFINIGTYEGLVKFDGVEFTILNRSTNKDLGIVSVRTILQDSRGNIWSIRG